MSNFLSMLSEGYSISEICRKTFFQACNICERIECGDNTNPLVTRIKELEAALKASGAPAEQAGNNARDKILPHVSECCQ